MGNKELELAWQYIEDTDVSVFLTGKAGTGKTTFLNRLKESMPKRMVVVAPTGVAAINASGVTIHSFFQLPIGIHLAGESPKDPSHFFTMSNEKKNIIRTLDLLVIDEISMVRCDLLDAIDGVLRKYKDRDKPFGGVQLLMIGDLQQLAPVANEQEWAILKEHYPTPYFFSSTALQQVQYITIELKQIYRQEDAHFINLLSNIREGNLDQPTVDSLNKRFIPDFVPPDDSDYIRLTTHNYKANQYNRRMLESLTGMSHVYESHTEGNFPENSYPAESKLELKIGAQVMYLKNDSHVPSRYFNGKIGKVTGFDEKGIFVHSPGEMTPVLVEEASWDNTEYVIDPETKEIKENVTGKFFQYPLRLAWSITVHKSQGLTFDHAILDINQSFAHGQVYVALSRCRTLEGIVLTGPLHPKSLSQDMAVEEYIRRELQAGKDAGQMLSTFKMRYFHTILDEAFCFRKLHSYVKDMVRIFNEHLYKQQPSLTQQWTGAEKDFVEEIIEVSNKFKRQYDKILADNGDDRHDPHFQERIHKAAEYFFCHLSTILVDLNNECKGLEIKNKQVKKRYDNAFERYLQEYEVRTLTLYAMKDQEFSVNGYLHEKSRILIPDAGQKVKRSKNRKSNILKEKKESTYETTLRLFNEGKDYNQIASERFLTPNTIFGHLMRLVDEGKVRFIDVVKPNHISEVRKIVEEQGMPEQHYLLDPYKPEWMCLKEFHRILGMLSDK